LRRRKRTSTSTFKIYFRENYYYFYYYQSKWQSLYSTECRLSFSEFQKFLFLFNKYDVVKTRDGLEVNCNVL